MFGVRPSSLFRSRWMALGWAVLVCLSAVSFVAGRGGSDGAGNAAREKAEAEAVNSAVAALN
jgi:hypothetical protein